MYNFEDKIEQNADERDLWQELSWFALYKRFCRDWGQVWIDPNFVVKQLSYLISIISAIFCRLAFALHIILRDASGQQPECL